MKKIAVFCSGGDAPGMNAAIRAVVRAGLYYGLQVYGIKRGYQGMIDGRFELMTSISVSNIIQRGGTILKTARSQEFTTKKGREMAAMKIRDLGIEGIVAIGGNGTYTGAYKFFEEHGIPIIGIPGTIDNDLFGTDYTIGYDTAINTALEAIDKIRDTADSNDRMFFVEVMGRDAGFIAMDVGISGGAEAILVPEFKTNLQDLVDTIRHGWGRKKGSQLIIVSEGDDAGGVFEVVEKIKAQVDNIEYRIVVLGHIQRGGTPSARDRVLASRLGAGAVKALIDGKENVAIGLCHDKLHFVSLHEAVEKKKPVAEELIELATILSS
ncbi:MAG: 6-phosphofructokinase [Sphingobacteriales bacterium]|nr:MAG: 6-phosphofructokinase [Sphingobacteriales bacterium]